MLSQRLGVPAEVGAVRPGHRTVGRQGRAAHLRGEEIPLALRIVQVARDATFHRLVAAPAHAAVVIRERSGRAFDPAVAPRWWTPARAASSTATDSRVGADAGHRAGPTALPRAERSTAHWRRWATSPTCFRRTWPGTRRAWRSWRPRPPSARIPATSGDGPPRRATCTTSGGSPCRARLAEDDTADPRRAGAGTAAPVLHRAGARPVAVPGRAGPDRGRSPRTARRVRLPPRRRGRRARPAGPAARRRGRVPAMTSPRPHRPALPPRDAARRCARRPGRALGRGQRVGRAGRGGTARAPGARPAGLTDREAR